MSEYAPEGSQTRVNSRIFGRKLNASRKLRNRKLAPDAVSVRRQLPVWGLCVKELSLLAREWGYSAATGSTGFASKSFGHKTAGGIIIPDSAKEKPSQGEITAVGPDGRDEAGKLIPIDLKVGDRVLFGKWSGTEVKLDGDELIIMKEADIMGIIAN